MVNTAAIFLALKESELMSFRRHQERICSPDKEKRRRAVADYRRFLDYLMSIDRITLTQKNYLENYRIPERHRTKTSEPAPKAES